MYISCTQISPPPPLAYTSQKLNENQQHILGRMQKWTSCGENAIINLDKCS